ncbi:MAG: hypothetical protein EXQ58_05350 [Acidobacteria bacterium]|nr:hypothetical protein [Acidobacteriota bacterium]
MNLSCLLGRAKPHGRHHCWCHRGVSLVDVFSPCVTCNSINTYPWFKPRVCQLGKEAG